jgi:hypothetical protein
MHVWKVGCCEGISLWWQGGGVDSVGPSWDHGRCRSYYGSIVDRRPIGGGGLLSWKKAGYD